MIIRFLIGFLLMCFPVLSSGKKNDLHAHSDTARVAYQAAFSKKVSGKIWDAQWDMVLQERLVQQIQARRQQQPSLVAVSSVQDDELLPEKSKNAKRNAKKREKLKEKKLLSVFLNSNSSDAAQPIVEQNRAQSPLTLQCKSIIGRLKTIDQNLGRKEFFALSVRSQQMDDLCRDVAEYTNAGRMINSSWAKTINRWCRIVVQDSCKQQQNGCTRDYEDDQRIIKDLRFIKGCL